MAEVTRRDILQLAAAGSVMLVVRPAGATPAAMQEAIKKVVGEAKVVPGRMQLRISPLSENGNTVPCTVTVETAMTAQDHVKAIHLFNEKNPQPNVISF